MSRVGGLLVVARSTARRAGLNGEIRGLAYSPSAFTRNPTRTTKVTDEMIRRDLAQLSKMTGRVRTYTVDYNEDRIPYIAKEFGMKVSLGLWFRGDKTYNEREIARAIKTVAANPGTIDRVFVGNEAVGCASRTDGPRSQRLHQARQGRHR